MAQGVGACRQRLQHAKKTPEAPRRRNGIQSYPLPDFFTVSAPRRIFLPQAGVFSPRVGGDACLLSGRFRAAVIAGHLSSMTCTCSCCCGACCDGSECTQTLPEDCAGEFLGRGVSCTPNPCLGVCCTITGTANTAGVEGFCEETTEATCQANGGDWYENQTCEYAPCTCDCSDPGWTVSFVPAGSYTFTLGKACVFPAHIQVTITDDDGTRTENYLHTSGGTFTVSFGTNALVEFCVNPDVVFDCNPDEGCVESNTGTYTYQECLDECVERVQCVEDVGCVTAFAHPSAGYNNLQECEDDCAWGLWVGDGPKAQFFKPLARARTPRPKKAKGPRPVLREAKGVGSVLKALLATVGITSKPGCKCNKRASDMDANGVDWCRQNIPLIVDWLREEHQRQKIRLPFSKLLASLLVRYAIYRAKTLTKGDKDA